MLDTLLMVRGEHKRVFEFSLGIELPISQQAATDCQTAVQQWQTDREIGELGGWIFHLNCKNVTASRVVPRFGQDGQVSGVSMRLQETEGRSGKLTISCPNELASARCVNFQRELKRSMEVMGRKANVNFSPNELFQVELNWQT